MPRKCSPSYTKITLLFLLTSISIWFPSECLSIHKILRVKVHLVLFDADVFIYTVMLMRAISSRFHTHWRRRIFLYGKIYTKLGVSWTFKCFHILERIVSFRSDAASFAYFVSTERKLPCSKKSASR